MRYTGKLYYPRGARLDRDPATLSAIQGRGAFDLYGQFKREMGQDQFDARVEAGPEVAPVLVRFHRVGQTAGYAAFARGTGQTAEKLEAVVAFLARLDGDDDGAVVDWLRGNAHFAFVSAGEWDTLAGDRKATVAAFFTDELALNDPLIHGLMNLSGAAFFDRLGLLE
jgi:hypothetical protein